MARVSAGEMDCATALAGERSATMPISDPAVKSEDFRGMPAPPDRKSQPSGLIFGDAAAIQCTAALAAELAEELGAVDNSHGRLLNAFGPARRQDQNVGAGQC